MTHCCSQCSFTAKFESALMMHHQLHHESSSKREEPANPRISADKSSTLPLGMSLDASYSGSKENKGLRLSRTSSATKLFEKLRSRIVRTRSRALFSHPEENSDITLMKDLSGSTDITSKALDSVLKSSVPVTSSGETAKESYACHLCSFDADRITVLDRHLLNDHKIGLDNLLKLVLAKTKDGLSEDSGNTAYGIREPYYKPVNEMIEEGEFVVETVVPKIKILKHASTNTELIWSDIPNLKDNCRKITNELEKLVKCPTDNYDKEDLMAKMQTLSECMGKFVDSTNTLKKVLAKEYESKTSVRDRLSSAEPFYELGLGDQDSPREWERAHSERMERSRHKYDESSRGKSKMSSESFYF